MSCCGRAAWMGKSDAWISERTGHELSGDMISRYDRGATTLEDLAYAPFPDVSRSIPELAAMADALQIVRLALARLHTPLHKNGGPPGWAYDQSSAITDTYQSGREDLNPGMRHFSSGRCCSSFVARVREPRGFRVRLESS